MSFSLDIKEELARVAPVCSHCNRAVLAAYARVAGVLHMQWAGGAHEEDPRTEGENSNTTPAQAAEAENTQNLGNTRAPASTFSLEVSSDIALVARLLTQILHDEYNLQTDITMRRSVLHKNVNYLIDVPAQPTLTHVLQDLGFFNKEDGGFAEGISKHIVAKQCCAAAYVRGAFLASGFVSDPKSNAHFEMTFENEALAGDIAEILSKNQIPVRVKWRRGACVVYLKSGEHIVNFLSFTGAHTQALNYENARVMKSVRSGVNRQINAELANQKRAAVAAVDQVFAARAVIEHYGTGKLTPALQEFIRLRIKYPNASLKELGKHANPPLSKSAVAHRVRRVMQLARNIKE